MACAAQHVEGISSNLSFRVHRGVDHRVSTRLLTDVRSTVPAPLLGPPRTNLHVLSGLLRKGPHMLGHTVRARSTLQEAQPCHSAFSPAGGQRSSGSTPWSALAVRFSHLRLAMLFLLSAHPTLLASYPFLPSPPGPLLLLHLPLPAPDLSTRLKSVPLDPCPPGSSERDLCLESGSLPMYLSQEEGFLD